MFKLNLVTPEKKVVADQELDEITLPAYAGELNILPGHAPLMTTLAAGILKYRLKNGESRKIAIGWGYCQVSAQGVNVLAETAMSVDEINVKSARENLKAQQLRLATETISDSDWEKVHNDIARLQAEIDLVEPSKKH